MRVFVLCVCIAVSSALVTVPLNTIPASVAEWRHVQVSSKLRESRGGMMPANVPKAYHNVNVTIGFPPKKFEMLIDLSMEGNWITSESCESLGCYTRDGYNSKDSLMHKPSGQTIRMSYGGGSGHGKLSTDTISIGGLHVISFTFGELESLKGAVFLRGPFDGVIGLAWKEAESNPENLISALFNRQVIETNSFSLSLSTRTGDQLILGGVDRSLFSFGIVYHPLLDVAPWAIQMSLIRVGETEMIEFLNPVAVVDLKVQKFSGSFNMTEAINAAIGTIAPDCSNLASLPVISVLSELGEYFIAPEDYVVQMDTDGGTACMSGWVGQEMVEGQANVLILGEAFLRKHYAHFDMENKKLGLALAT